MMMMIIMMMMFQGTKRDDTQRERERERLVEDCPSFVENEMFGL